MNNEKLMKIFAVAKINRNYSLFIIHYSFLISRTHCGRNAYRIKNIKDMIMQIIKDTKNKCLLTNQQL